MTLGVLLIFKFGFLNVGFSETNSILTTLLFLNIFLRGLGFVLCDDDVY